MTEILVVDDDPVVIEVMRGLLEAHGFDVHTATTWPRMNDLLFARPIAVLLLDVNLPGLKGNTLAEIVKRNLRLPPSIVLFSGMPEDELRRLTRTAGALNFLCKGESTEKIVDTIRAAVQDFEARRARVPKDPEAPGKASRSSPLRTEPASQPSSRRDRTRSGDRG